MSGLGTSLALIGAYVLAGELAAASGAHPHAFGEFENAMKITAPTMPPASATVMR